MMPQRLRMPAFGFHYAQSAAFVDEDRQLRGAAIGLSLIGGFENPEGVFQETAHVRTYRPALQKKGSVNIYR